MSRTLTGSYILRPTTFDKYLSSGTFSNYFSTDEKSAPSSWNSSMAPGTNIGDNSDSTYYSDTSVSATSTGGKNAIMKMTVSSGSVPTKEYTVTKVTIHYRTWASGETNSVRVLNLWNTLYYTGGYTAATPSACISAGRFGLMTCQPSSSATNASTSIATRTETATSFTNSTIPASKYPDRMAICVQAYKTSHLTSFNSWRLYDVWWTVEWSYTEDEVKTYVYTDAGCNITGDATIPANSNTLGQTYVEDYAGETKTLTANVAAGYEFDGWYLNGTKVSSSATYTVTIAANAQLYAICYIRQLYVGTEQVEAVYAGTTETDVYVGTTKIFGESLIKADATAVG